MNKSAMLATASALGLLAPLSASATTVVLDWSVSGYGSGTITAGPATASQSGHTGYVATNVTGTWLGSPVVLIPSGGFENDNLVYNPVTASPSGESFLDTQGVAFAYGEFDAVSLFFNGTEYREFSVNPTNPLAAEFCAFLGKDCNTQTAAATVTLDTTAGTTPLPTSLPLFAGGAAVVGLLAKRRKKKSAEIRGA